MRVPRATQQPFPRYEKRTEVVSLGGFSRGIRSPDARGTRRSEGRRDP